MMPSLILLPLIALALGTTVAAGLRGRWLAVTVAALLIGAAGDAWQDKTGLEETPGSGAASPPPASLIQARGAFLGQFNQANHWLIIADSFAARGKTEDAVGLLRSAVRAHPRDYALWLALGNALVDHAHGLSPAARLAYARSAALAPASPAPGYFLGSAMLRSGDPDGALAEWRKVLAAAPANASWRPYVEDGVATVDAARRH